MTVPTRQVIVGQTIALEVEIKDANDVNIDPDTSPQIEILDDHSAVQHALSSTNVTRLDVGKFRYNYLVPIAGDTGIWTDHWRVVLNGYTTDAELYFVVLSATAAVEVAGAQIGDDPNVQYTQEEIYGINILLQMLQKRLKNEIQVETTDAYGNLDYIDCNIFTTDELVWFLSASLSEFNEFPHFSSYRFSDNLIYERCAYVIVEGAAILAWGAQMIIEAGREFVINDNGINYQNPPLSATINNELSHFVTRHQELIKNIKYSLKPQPRAFGSFRVLATNPAISKLRHLRERRII